MGGTLRFFSLPLVLGYAVRNCFSVFYPAIVEEFGGWRRGNTALIFSISIIVYGLMAPVAGGPRGSVQTAGDPASGSDYHGRRGCLMQHRHHTVGNFISILGFLVACGLSLSGWTPLTAIVSNWFIDRRGLAFGVLSAGFGGSLIYATVAQQLITDFGWKTAYILIGGSSIVVIVPLCGPVHAAPAQNHGI